MPRRSSRKARSRRQSRPTSRRKRASSRKSSRSKARSRRLSRRKPAAKRSSRRRSSSSRKSSRRRSRKQSGGAENPCDIKPSKCNAICSLKFGKAKEDCKKANEDCKRTNEYYKNQCEKVNEGESFCKEHNLKYCNGTIIVDVDKYSELDDDQKIFFYQNANKFLNGKKNVDDSIDELIGHYRQVFINRQKTQHKFDTHQKAAKILYAWFLYVEYDELGNRQDRDNELKIRVQNVIIGQNANNPSQSPFRKHYPWINSMQLMQKQFSRIFSKKLI